MRILVVSIYMFISCLAHAQLSYYLSNEIGDNSFEGMTPEEPFRTIDYALPLLMPGDTLQIMKGIYQNENFGNGDYWKSEKTADIINVHGDIDNYIVIKNFRDHNPVFMGDGFYIILIRNCSYLKIEGLEVEGEADRIPLELALEYQFAYREEGSDSILYRIPFGTPPEIVEQMTFEPLVNIQRPPYFDSRGIVVVESHHIDLSHNYVHHTPGVGIRFRDCGYFNATFNEVHDCSRKSYSGTHGFVLENCQSIDQSAETKIVVANNYVHHNYNEMYSWAPTKTIVTPKIDEGKGISLQRNDPSYGWTTGRILIVNNLTHHNGFSGLHANTTRGVDFVNNTSYHDSYTGEGNNHGLSLQASNDIRIINNLIVNDTIVDGHGMAMSNSSFDIEVNNNLVYGTFDNQISEIALDMIIENPLFENADLFNFNLKKESPAIDQAISMLAPTQDYYGDLRDQNPDIGAIEYDVLTSVNTFEELPISNIFPNPVQRELYFQSNGLVDYTIIDISGRKVVSGKLDNQIKNEINVINVSGLVNGFYIFKCGKGYFKFLKYE